MPSRHVGAEKTAALCLANGQPQRLTAKGLLGTDIYVTLRSADGVRGDRHALENLLRHALEDASVHEGSGVTLVSVANNVLPSAPEDLATVLHFEAGRITCSAPARSPLRTTSSRISSGFLDVTVCVSAS